MRWLALIAALLAVGPTHAGSVTDLAGRTVQIPDKVERVILGEGRFLPVLAILDRADPTARVVGMLGDFARFDPAGHAQYAQAFPSMSDIAEVGQPSGGGFSTEQAIALAPDVAIFGLRGHGPSARNTEIIAPLEAAGIAVVFVDFRVDPLANTPRSIELLGKVLDREREAADFVSFYTAQLDRLDTAVAAAGKRPTVFLESRVGLREECCESIANAMLARFVTRAGGINMADDLLPGVVGLVGIEHLLTHQPDVYVATAIGTMASRAAAPNRVVLGAEVDKSVAQTSLANALRRPEIAELRAVREKRAYALLHHFYNSPFNVAAVQAIATWLHPTATKDLDPQATLAEMYRRFQPFALSGTYWVKAP